MTQKLKSLPAELDNDTVIFSYGSLLDHATLRGLLTTRGEFQILETSDAAEAARLAKDNPKDIVILKNVRLENVRVCIVTETRLRRWFQNRGGKMQEIIDAGITTREVPKALFLCARPAEPFEKGRALNGGLICNLTESELAHLDKYEWLPVLKRERAPELKIGEQTYVPEHIIFYAVTESFYDITAEEKAERASLLNLNRKRGAQSPQARWQKNVRRG
jgi:hypothetical protein